MPIDFSQCVQANCLAWFKFCICTTKWKRQPACSLSRSWCSIFSLQNISLVLLQKQCWSQATDEKADFHVQHLKGISKYTADLECVLSLLLSLCALLTGYWHFVCIFWSKQSSAHSLQTPNFCNFLKLFNNRTSFIQELVRCVVARKLPGCELPSLSASLKKQLTFLLLLVGLD